MTNPAFVSSSELGNRRNQLRRQRRLKVVQVIWQALAVSGLTASGFWAISQPIWLIRQPQQVEIVGNQLLSDQRIRKLLPLSYPQSLWKIQPQALAQSLETQGQIAEVSVARQLFPPRLTIEITERRPVAIAQPAIQSQPDDQQLGWLDAEGGWIPLESYTQLERSRQLPTLKVIGNPDQYRPLWPQMYAALSRSPVEIDEINWQDPANLIISTEIGIVHLGSYSSRFPEQLRVIDRMRNLPEKLNADEVDYIDLKNPDSPLIQTLPDS